MTDANDRLAEIRARLDAYNTRVQRQAAAKAARRPYHLPLGESETDLNRNAPDDITHLLSLVEQLQGQLDQGRAVLTDRIAEWKSEQARWQNLPTSVMDPPAVPEEAPPTSLFAGISSRNEGKIRCQKL